MDRITKISGNLDINLREGQTKGLRSGKCTFRMHTKLKESKVWKNLICPDSCQAYLKVMVIESS